MNCQVTEQKKISDMFEFVDYGHVCTKFSDMKGKNCCFEGFYRWRKDGKLSDEYDVSWNDNDGGSCGDFDGDADFVRDFLKSMRECKAWGHSVSGDEEGYVWFEVKDGIVTVFTDGDGAMIYSENYTIEEWNHIVDEMEKGADYLIALKD